jgi:hypothetical protein
MLLALMVAMVWQNPRCHTSSLCGGSLLGAGIDGEELRRIVV